jgi:hypothetical protein
VPAAAHQVFAAEGLDRLRRLGHVLLVALGVGDVHLDQQVAVGHDRILQQERSLCRNDFSN